MTSDIAGVVDALPGLVWTTGIDGAGGFFNRRWREYTGLDADGARGRGWLTAIHPDDIESVLDVFETPVPHGATAEVEARLRRGDGEHRWFLLRLSRASNACGDDPSWCWLGTEADELRTGPGHAIPDGRLRRFIDMLPTQVVFMTPDLDLEYVNREVLEFFGKSLNDLKRWDRPGGVNHPDDVPSLLALVENLRTRGGTWDTQSRMRRADGVYRWVRSRMVPSKNAQGDIVRYCSVQTDVDDLKQAEDLLAGEVALLEMVALGRPLFDVLEALSRLVERISVGCLCSILVVPDRKHFQVGAGPSLPDSYNAALDGMRIDPDYGPCSMAVMQKTPVVAADAQNDPRWASSAWPPLMREHNLGSCWSMPIISVFGEVSGIFALYRREPVGPTPDEQRLIDRFTKIAGIAIDRAQADEALKESEAELRRAHAQIAVEKKLLEMTASGRPLDEVLDAVCRFVEEIFPECICGVYPIDWSGPVFKYGVAPSLPASYIEPIKGWPVAVDKAPCGIAVAEDRQVIVVDVETDPIWRGTEYRDHVVSHGLRSVWSTLIRSVDERVLGSFCIYQRQPATPTPHHQKVISHATHIASIALDRAQADEALMASEAELRRAHAQLAEGQRLSRTGSFTSDLRMDRHEWSEEYYRIFELDPATPPSVAAVRERVHPDDRELFDAEIRRGMEGGDADFTFRILTPLGGLKHLRGVARVTEHVAGRPIFTGTIQDITQTKLAEAALTAQEAELRQAYDYLTEAQRLSKTGSFTWDVLADRHNWSDEIRRIFGFDLEVPITMGMIQAVVHPDDMAEVARVIGGAAEGHDFDLVFRVLTAKGEVRHAHVVGHRIADIIDRPVFLGALQDVTDRKLAEERLDRARRELAHVSRITALSALTASIAHEVNQPLAGIIANASTCLRLLAADPPNTEGAQATAQRTIRDANRASEVIKRLRALFSRRPPANEPLDLNDATREVLTLASSELEGARVVLQTDLDANLPTIVGDRVQLQQVILNLVLNAADAMSMVDDRPRELLISTVRDGDDQVRLSVRDAGVGAKAEQLAQIFDAFYTTKPEGMGVGLSISRSIIEFHGGHISAASNEGAGLTFSFSVPVTSFLPAGAGDGGPDRDSAGAVPVFQKAW